MRSSSGQHFIALDHLRAVAAFMVVGWHFLHSTTGTPVPFAGAPVVFPLALVDEGHTGVALFMVLSGYLFAKLLNGKSVSYPAFFWNRFIRLAPLLLLTFALAGLERYLDGGSFLDYLVNLPRGLIYPVWPNGGWSITTEIHFYLALPILLLLVRRSIYLPLLVVLAATAFRCIYFTSNGEVQTIAYWTIIGRIDQFIIGILGFELAKKLKRRTWPLLVVPLIFTLFWWWFDASGGFYLRPTYPSSSPVWIWIPTMEGMAYVALIIWYDGKNINHDSVVSKLMQRLGEYSYSIYLLHVFIVFRVARFIDHHVMPISNFYTGLFWAACFFVAMLVPGYLSYRFVESPFLKLRVKYVKQQ